MSRSSLDNRLILHNTLLLYGRMLITVWLNLWATRLTLLHLGVDDLGIYGVVGSVVSMFGIFTGGITTAVQRYITFELGKGEQGNVNRVFNSSLNLLLIVAGILVLLFELLGLWLLDSRLNIPEVSKESALWVFQFSVVAFVANVIAIPYNALIVAHERMSAFAFISILQVAFSCAAAWSLSLLSGGRLVYYGATMAAIAVLIRLFYQIYCRRSFPEACFHWGIKWSDVHEMAQFAGVSTLSGVFQMISNEGLMLVINLTFGVAVNAVYSIAIQLKNLVLSFSLNVFKAIQPQIIKTYAEGNIADHIRLVCTGSKIEVFLIYLILLPFLFRTQQVMELWLGSVPPHAVAFARGTIFLSLSYAAFEPIRTAVLATGRIFKFMLVPEAFFLLVLPAGFLVAKLTDSPDLMLITIVLMDVLACLLRVFLGIQVSPLKARQLLTDVILPCVAVGLFGTAVCYFLSELLSPNLWGLLILVLFNSVALLGLISVFHYSTIKRLWRSRHNLR